MRAQIARNQLFLKRGSNYTKSSLVEKRSKIASKTGLPGEGPPTILLAGRHRSIDLPLPLGATNQSQNVSPYIVDKIRG